MSESNYEKLQLQQELLKYMAGESYGYQFPSPPEEPRYSKTTGSFNRNSLSNCQIYESIYLRNIKVLHEFLWTIQNSYKNKNSKNGINADCFQILVRIEELKKLSLKFYISRYLFFKKLKRLQILCDSKISFKRGLCQSQSS